MTDPTDGAPFAAAALREWDGLAARHVAKVPPIVGSRVVIDPVPLGWAPAARALHAVGADRRPVPLWPYTQVMHARSLLKLVAEDRAADVPPLLMSYSRGDAFAERPSSDRRYVDDNAWVALAQWQERVISSPSAQTSTRTARQLEWLRSQVDADGGALWVEGGDSRHACSTGGVGAALALVPHSPTATIELSDRVDEGPVRPTQRHPDALAAAVACEHFLRSALVNADGLVQDNVSAAGTIDPTLWSYNQGLLVRLNVALAARGIAGAQERAVDAAASGLAHFRDDTLWSQPVAFNAIWLRGLVALGATLSVTEPLGEQIAATLTSYAARLDAWLTDNGPFVRGGNVTPDSPGRYESGESAVLDLAGAIQTFTLTSLPRHQWSLVI